MESDLLSVSGATTPRSVIASGANTALHDYEEDLKFSDGVLIPLHKVARKTDDYQ